MKVKISIADNIKALVPGARCGWLSCKVRVQDTSDGLDQLIENRLADASELLIKEVESKWEIIAEARTAYKACGKEPSRYRPSSEALLRRIRTGKGLYRINSVVDVINVLSFSSHFSIGGFDLAKIDGDVYLDVGDDKAYKAIGRGELNIESMPGLRDDQGFFGTPTSDSERTMVNSDMKELLLVYYDFGSNLALHDALADAEGLLTQYCDAMDIETLIV